MAFDRVLTDAKDVGDRMIGESFSEKCCDLTLAHGKSEVVAGPTAPTRTTEDWADHRLTRVDHHQRAYKNLS